MSTTSPPMRNASTVAAIGIRIPPARVENHSVTTLRACGSAAGPADVITAASSRRPPVMAIPSSSSDTPGVYSPTIRPS